MQTFFEMNKKKKLLIWTHAKITEKKQNRYE